MFPVVLWIMLSGGLALILLLCCNAGLSITSLSTWKGTGTASSMSGVGYLILFRFKQIWSMLHSSLCHPSPSRAQVIASPVCRWDRMETVNIDRTNSPYFLSLSMPSVWGELTWFLNFPPSYPEPILHSCYSIARSFQSPSACFVTS